MAKLNLKDSYLTVPVTPPSRELLCFRWNSQIWRFMCLTFCLSSAPWWCFTKLLRPVMAYLCGRSMRLIICLDDILLMAQDPVTLETRIRWMVDLLQHLGFLINQEKSVLYPATSMEFLGFRVDATAATLSLPPLKIRSIKHGASPCASLTAHDDLTSGQDHWPVSRLYPGHCHSPASLSRLAMPQDCSPSRRWTSSGGGYRTSRHGTGERSAPH